MLSFLAPVKIQPNELYRIGETLQKPQNIWFAAEDHKVIQMLSYFDFECCVAMFLQSMLRFMLTCATKDSYWCWLESSTRPPAKGIAAGRARPSSTQQRPTAPSRRPVTPRGDGAGPGPTPPDRPEPSQASSGEQHAR